jgi:hypothetical protein
MMIEREPGKNRGTREGERGAQDNVCFLVAYRSFRHTQFFALLLCLYVVCGAKQTATRNGGVAQLLTRGPSVSVKISITKETLRKPPRR